MDVDLALLADAATTYLPYLHANAVAWRAGRRRSFAELAP